MDRERRGAGRAALQDRASRSRFALWCIATVFLVVMAGTTLPSPLFGLYEQRLHTSSLSVTVIYGIYSVGIVVALVVLARFGSAIGLRTRLAAGLALSVMSAAVFLVTTSLGLLIVARVFSGLAAGLTSGTATSAMIELGGRERRARLAVIGVGVNFGGLAVGSAMAGVLSDFGSGALTLPFLVDLIASLAVVPALLAVASGFKDSTAAHAAAGQLIVRRASPRLAPIIGSFGLIAGLALLATTLLAPNFPG